MLNLYCKPYLLVRTAKRQCMNDFMRHEANKNTRIKTFKIKLKLELKLLNKSTMAIQVKYNMTVQNK